MKIIYRTLQVFAISSAFILTGCKKEAKVENEVAATTDSVSVADKLTKTAAVAPAEWKVDKVDALLKASSNDTLYVTNFFATWCGPCMKEIPHFKDKMTELNGKPVKFTFVSLDDKADWAEAVTNFASENNISKEVVLLDGNTLNDAFFKNFKNWRGESIPFTYMKKGAKTDETVGMMTKEELDAKIKSFGF